MRFRALTLLDTFSRESLTIYVDKSIKGEQVCEELEKIKAARGLPQRIKVDNGPEFISQALDAWAYFNKVKLDYSRPGTPTDNPHIESFNGSFREECLYMNWFMSPEDARDIIERWRSDYNEFRPHSALTYLTPAELARKTGSEAVGTSISSRSAWTTLWGTPQNIDFFSFTVDYYWGIPHELEFALLNFRSKTSQAVPDITRCKSESLFITDLYFSSSIGKFLQTSDENITLEAPTECSILSR